MLCRPQPVCVRQKNDPFFAACSYHCEKNANMLTAKIKIANLKTNFAWFVMTKKRILFLRQVFFASKFNHCLNFG